MKFVSIIEAKYLDEYKIFLKFDDGVQGVVDFAGYLDGETFSPLKNKD